MIYLDTSAAAKLVISERETEALRAWCAAHAQAQFVTSALTTVELLRACRRLTRSSVAQAESLLATMDLIPIDRPVLVAAAAQEPAELRSLDAIHVASARSLGAEVTAFVTYDHRLARAAAALDLPVVVPT